MASTHSEGQPRVSPHRYNTRSSPQPTSAIFRLSAELFVKETVYARDHSGKRLPPHIFEAESWDAMKTQIFSHCLPHMMNKATYVGEPRVWSVSDESPSALEFETFVSIKLGRNIYKPTNTSQAHRYLQDHRNDTFTVAVFKWGNNINNASDLQQFQDQCIQPPTRDRAGAASESMHQSIVAQLKEKWGHVYNGFDATWRIWAAGILKQPLHTHSSAISLPPPANLLHLFERVPYGAEVRIEQAQQNFHLSTDIVNACLKDYDVLIRAAQDMLAASQEIFRRISSGIDVMNTKKSSRPWQSR
ncbi:hypothetical protein LEN26_013505 [Aphanomyces euteiches]|nr:hypothetical protein LEN26_013505 [Aphanomyces euteiches]